MSSTLKRDGARVFEEKKKKSCSGVFRTKLHKMGPQFWGFSSFIKNQHKIFLIFFTKLQQHKVLRLTYMIFLEKIMFRDFWNKSDQNEVFKYYQKSVYETFLDFFCMKLQQNTQMILLGKIFALGFLDKRWSGMSFWV